MKMAILGAGGIAKQMARTIAGMPSVEAYAIGARDITRAEAFAQEFGFTKAYGSYEEMLADDAIDLVYVATPHSHHYQHAMLCLQHGKNVLCEKSFMLNAAQAKEVLGYAKAHNLLCAEAIWTRYLPMRKTLDELIASGIIGEVSSLSANLAYPNSNVERIRKPELAGGALLDLGVYVLNFASMLFGDDIKDCQSVAVMNEFGVDAQNAITMTYQDGKMATLYTSTLAKGNRKAVINGTKGYIEVDNINNYERFRVYDLDYQHVKTIEAPPQITGFEYEVASCERALAEGALECPEMPHSEIICIMEQMDALRASWGMRYPNE